MKSYLGKEMILPLVKGRTKPKVPEQNSLNYKITANYYTDNVTLKIYIQQQDADVIEDLYAQTSEV